MTQFLRERGEQNIRYIDIFGELRTPTTRQDFLNECKSPFNLGHQQWNVILPNLSDLLIQFRPSVLFELFHHLIHCRWVKRTLLWIVPQFLIHKKPSYIITCCKYMADFVLHLKSPNLLTLLVKKPNGTVRCRTYNYKRDKLKYILEVDPTTGVPNGHVAIPDERTNVTFKPISSPSSSVAAAAFAIDSQVMGMKQFDRTDCDNTFKISLNEEELVARNTLKLPYEKYDISSLI